LGKIIPLNNITRFDLPVNQVLDNAKDELQDVVILGYCKGGKEEYYATNMSDPRTGITTSKSTSLSGPASPRARVTRTK
jgi:hypothetical protein